jgi:hypothetical protein
MKLKIDAWRCGACGHTWIAAGEIPPKQCAKCRSRKWHELDGAEKFDAVVGKMLQAGPSPLKRKRKEASGDEKPENKILEKPEIEKAEPYSVYTPPPFRGSIPKGNGKKK